MNPHDQAIIHSSLESDWRTPDPLYAALDREFRFDLDAAADARSTKVPQAWFGPGSLLAENALTTPWDYAGWGTRVFLNPPFSRTKAAAYRTGRIKVGGAWQEHPVDLGLANVYDIAAWARKARDESQRGVTVVGLFPFAPQTDWYRRFVYGHTEFAGPVAGVPGASCVGWGGHAATQERRLPHRVSFLRPDGTDAANAGVNTAVIVWEPAVGIVGPWQPWSIYWSWR